MATRQCIWPLLGQPSGSWPFTAIALISLGVPVTRVAGRALAGCETAEGDGGQGVNLGQSDVVPDGAGPLGIPKQRADDPPQPIRCLGVVASRPPSTSSRVSVAAILAAGWRSGGLKRPRRERS